jgi:hypothetical protein
MAGNFKVNIPKDSPIYDLFDEEDVTAVARALERVLPKLAENFPYACYQLLNELGVYPQARNRTFGRIVSFLVDYQLVPIFKDGKRYSSIVYRFKPPRSASGVQS